MKKEIRDEVQKISPGFPVREASGRPSLPDRYFEKMQEDVLRQIEQASRARKPGRRWAILTWQRVAAAILVGLGIWLLVRQVEFTPVGHTESRIALTRDEAMAYALAHPGEFEALIEEELMWQTDAGKLFPGADMENLEEEELDAVLDALSDENIEELL